MESMVEWQQGRYLDPGVWDHLRPRLNPRLMPAASVLQPRPPAKRKLEEVEPDDSVRNDIFSLDDRMKMYFVIPVVHLVNQH